MKLILIISPVAILAAGVLIYAQSVVDIAVIILELGAKAK